jgi:UDP-2,4-diacetamido-2,4,6-trideoxy-beta-L-altropyranose hydrolase
VNIVFRADASPQIGTGHVMRCLALAAELRDRGASVGFVCRYLPEYLAQQIRKQGWECLLLPRPDEAYAPLQDDPPHAEWLGVSWQRDAEETVRALDGREVDWIVVDHYAIDHRWHREVRSCASRIMVLDDLADRRYQCDILQDQTYGRSEKQYRELVSPSTRLLLGAGNALLRPEFSRLRRTALEARRKRTGVQRILVTMGGVDSANVTSVVLEGLTGVDWPEKPVVDVVLGNGAPHLQEVKAQAEACELSVCVHSNVRNMSELMQQADLAIGAGGSTSWERCCLGLPSLLVELAENQREVVASLDRAGAAIALALQNLQQEIAAVCRKLLENPALLSGVSDAAARITDGMGAPLCAIRLCPRAAKDGSAVTLRRVVVGDVDRLFEWQSDPETRRYSHDARVPEYDEHVRWLEGKLADPGCYFYMIERDGEPAGVVRLDYHMGAAGGAGGYLLSIHIAPGYYRRGLGEIALEYMHGLFADYELYADILPQNKASQQLFAAAGFSRIGVSDRYIKMPAGRNQE